MKNTNHIQQFLETSVRMISVPLVVLLTTSCASIASTEKVTLRDGKTYEVETVRGLPVRYTNDQIRVGDLGIRARFTLEQADAPPYVWRLVAELAEKGRFAVTVTTPLDRAASTIFEVSGPGKIDAVFFPQADHPLIWEGIDQPAVHWFPFHFVFEEKESRNRFEFTQWVQMDDRTWKETSTLVEKMKQEMLKKQKQ